jgi:hypothetical protein
LRKRNDQLLFQVGINTSFSTAERSFRNLKIIKNYLGSTMAQERLNALAVIFIEVEEGK